MMKSLLKTSFLILTCIGYNSCELINPEEKIPSYIRIQNQTLETDLISQGSSSHKITDAWVTINTSYLGTFEVPSTIPVLLTGKQHLILRAGIKENGISATRVAYPFYQPFETDILLSVKELDTIQPKYVYNPLTQFKWMDDCNDVFSMDKSSRNTATISITSNVQDIYEGKGSMEILLDSAHNFFEILTKDYYDLPRDKPIWLELNFKTDIPVGIGLINASATNFDQYSKVFLNTSNSWNKVYLNFTPNITSQPTGTYFKVFIGTILPEGTTSAHIYLDNIKLLTF